MEASEADRRSATMPDLPGIGNMIVGFECVCVFLFFLGGGSCS